MIDVQYPVETYHKKNPATDTPVCFAQVGLNFPFLRKKSNLDNKTRVHYRNCYWFPLIEAIIC